MIPRQSGGISIGVTDLDFKVKMLSKILPGVVDKGFEAGIRGAVVHLTAEVKNLLEGDVLNRISGVLYRSIHGETYRKHGTLVGVVGTPVEYAAIHEFGGTIRPKEAGGFLFLQRDGEVFAVVKEVEIPKRPYMSRAMKEQQSKVKSIIRDYINAAIANKLHGKSKKVVGQRVAIARKIGG